MPARRQVLEIVPHGRLAHHRMAELVLLAAATGAALIGAVTAYVLTRRSWDSLALYGEPEQMFYASRLAHAGGLYTHRGVSFWPDGQGGAGTST